MSSHDSKGVSLVGIASMAMLAILAFEVRPSLADPGDVIQKFMVPDSTYGWDFGSVVAPLGENVVIGSQFCGMFRLYDSSTGNALRVFPIPGASNLDFGFCAGSVSRGVLSTVLIGVPSMKVSGVYEAGKAFMYDGSTGAMLRTFVNPTPAYREYFGNAVAGVGENVVVASYWDNAAASHAGAAYMYSGTTGQLLRTFLPPSATAGEKFGTSLAALGNDVLIGSPYAPSPSGTAGAGAVYQFDGLTGSLVRTFNNPAPTSEDAFGCSVAVVGDNVLVGAKDFDVPGAERAGAAYLFDRLTGDLLLTFSNPTPDKNESFGFPVAAVGDNVLIGARSAIVGGTRIGEAYLFDGTTGQLLMTIRSPDAGAREFSWCVAGLGNNILVGDPEYTDFHDFGAVYLIEGIPEPTTLALLAFGATSLLRGRRRARF